MNLQDIAPRSRTLDLDELLDDRSIRVIVCCGSGGVGKTTTAAAVALRAADRGRKVVVLTIDPARRLAQSEMVGERLRKHAAEGKWVGAICAGPLAFVSQPARQAASPWRKR